MENSPTSAKQTPFFRKPALILKSNENAASKSSADVSDGSARKPMAPVQMTISPGNAANEDKFAAKMKRLELSRKKSRPAPIELKTPSKVDLFATAKFYAESSLENIAHTPRNMSIREPLRTPARPFLFADDDDVPRDSMQSNATYVLTTPRLQRTALPHNDPFTPSLATPSRRPATAAAAALTPLSYEEKLERQFVALTSWANVILGSASFVSEIDLGTSKQDASRKLQEMLAKPSKRGGGGGGEESGVMGGGGRRYTDLCLRKKCLDYLKRADSVYQSTMIPSQLKAMVERGEISIKKDIDVYANIGVQTTIVSLLFTLHPFWLFIAVETVCAEFKEHDTASLDARLPFSSASFVPATVAFIRDQILANANLMSKKKCAIGTVKKIVTEKGREMLHKHCITCVLSMAVLLEQAKCSYLFENTPGLFVKNAEIKTVSEFCTELSRLVLSASGTPLNKAFDKAGFRRSYRQSFLEEYQYVMRAVRDMADGIILGRLVELLTDSPPLSIIANMRNPQGDRIRKKGNVEKALAGAADHGIDVKGISIDQILAAHRESCLELMWRLVGVYVMKEAEQRPLRRESICLESGEGLDEEEEDTTMSVPLGGMAESAFTLYQQLAAQFGLTLHKWADLEDGVLLSSIWQHYNPAAPDVRFYDGNGLFEKVANAASSDLGIPLALTELRDERQLGLFAHMFLSRLISFKKLRDSEASDGESDDASSIVSMIRKEGANLTEETERIQRRRLNSERALSARLEEERLKEEEERRRNEELRRRFDEEEEERLTSEWRSPPRSSESITEEERMLIADGDGERIEEEMRRMREAEEARRVEEEERLKKEEEEERVRKEKEEEEERVRKEEEERVRVLAEEMECLRLEEEARVREAAAAAAEEAERRRKEEEEEVARRLAEEKEMARREEEERVRREEEARLRAEEEERLRREAEEEERRKREKERMELMERAALTIQCWRRRILAGRVMKIMRDQRSARLAREEQEGREAAAAEKIAVWISGRLAIRAARVELAVRRRQRMEEEERRRMLEMEKRRVVMIDAVRRIQHWYRSMLAIRAARHLLLQLREEKQKREELARWEMLVDESARKIQTHFRGWRQMREAKDELARLRIEREEQMRRQREEAKRLERLRLEEEVRMRKEEEERIRREEEEAERLRLEEEERARKAEEDRIRREEEEAERIRLEEEERVRKEEEERRLREEEEARLVELSRLQKEEEERRMKEDEERRNREEERIRREAEAAEKLRREEEERMAREEEERRLRDEEEARLEVERQLREEAEERERRAAEEAAALAEAERRRREEEEEEARRMEEEIYQAMIAATERDGRLRALQQTVAAKKIQRSVRGWLQQRQQAREAEEAQLQQQMRVQHLLQEARVDGGASGSRQTFSGYSNGDLVQGMREIRRRQRKLSLSLLRVSSITRPQAATKIQSWWRGIQDRRAHQREIQLIAVRMREYKERANVVMQGGADEEHAIPVSRRLQKARETILNPSMMYEVKVACYTILSLCRLSTLYCERAVVLDLPRLALDLFLVQADRSPAWVEVIEYGCQVMEEFTKCSAPSVRAAVIEESTDFVRLALHQMLAFWRQPGITTTAMRTVMKLREIVPVEKREEVFINLDYYVKQTDMKIGKLPHSDPRHSTFLAMKRTLYL